MRDFKTNLETLIRIRQQGIHSKYIEYIRYPYFRNLEKDTRIDFDFPITFLVGKNGGGKSSTLQSLYGCPSGYSLGDYWFTTELDPIKEFENQRNCFIYGYKSGNENCEVIKHRIFRAGNPDYWETAKPVKIYGMINTERFSPIEKKVAYIDFRSQLSAFDKFMHFTSFQQSNRYKTKQDYIRFGTKKIKAVLENNQIINLRGYNRNKQKIVLDETQIEIINYILGKDYSSVEIIEHSFFKGWGISIRLMNSSMNYSEAFAGSGETAVVMLVHKIFNTDNESLILLDEPETSLHSGAQKRLINFILDQCVKKHHQFVISTHSPFLLENMPDNSIKVFSTIKSGKFIIYPKRNYREAFHELEITSTSKKTIIVEDSFAKLIIDKTLHFLGQATKELFEVKYLPGGADDIKQRIAAIMDLSDTTFIIFDGDQKVTEKHIDINTIPPSELDSSLKINKLIRDQCGCEIKLSVNGGNSHSEGQKIEVAKQYLNFYEKHVFYFPETIPEDIIWDEEFATKRLQLATSDRSLSECIIDAKDSKDKLYKLCLEIFNDSSNMNSLYLDFINNWIKSNDENYIKIVEIINKIKAYN